MWRGEGGTGGTRIQFGVCIVTQNNFVPQDHMSNHESSHIMQRASPPEHVQDQEHPSVRLLWALSVTSLLPPLPSPIANSAGTYVRSQLSLSAYLGRGRQVVGNLWSCTASAKTKNKIKGNKSHQAVQLQQSREGQQQAREPARPLPQEQQGSKHGEHSESRVVPT